MITLALIGVGQWGRNYIKTIGNIRNVNLKYICASSEKNLKTFSGKYVKLTNYKDLIKHKDIDGIIIATPATTHFTILKYLIPFGYFLLVEKPLTINMRDALMLKELNKIFLDRIMVGHIYLYNPAFIKSLELINKIGQIRYIDFEGCNWGPFRPDVSALWDWVSHDISMCLAITKKNPLEISAWSVESDMVYLRLKFETNINVSIKIGRLSPVKKRKVEIIGDKGALIFDDTIDNKVAFFSNGNITYPTFEKIEPLRMQLDEFVNCIKNKKKPRTDFLHAFNTIKIIDFAEKSINSNGKIVYV